MQYELNLNSITLYLYNTLILSIGVYCLFKYIQGIRSQNRKMEWPIRAWNITWLDFFITLVGLFSLLLLSQILLKKILPMNMTIIWAGAIVSGTTHLVTIFFLLILNYIGIRSILDEINVISFNFIKHLKTGFLFFLMALPLVLATAFCWSTLLEYLNTLGFNIDTSRQSLIDVFNETDDISALTVISLIAIITAPIAEELLFRGGIYRLLKKHIKPSYALIMSSSLFALMHFNMLSFLPLFLMGILLGYSYERTGSIMTPIFFHGFFNLNTVIQLLVESKIS